MWVQLLRGKTRTSLKPPSSHLLQEQVGPFKAYKALTVCNYAVGGNYAGKPMYKIGAACSECDAGYSCEDDLCMKN